MEIICDKRETKICAYAGQYGNISSEHLTVGDFLIGYRCSRTNILIPLVIIERKTWADLAASIKDGRIRNIQKLRTYREETGARIGYLLEGATPKNPLFLVEGIPYKNMRAHLDHLLFRDHIIELHSLNPSDSLHRLMEFAENLKKYGEEKSDELPGRDGLAAAKVKHVLTDEQIQDKLWASFTGVSESGARAFRHLRVCSLYLGQISAAELAEIQVGTRRFGTARAESILSSLQKETTLEKLLCAIPGISSKRARLILDCLVDDTRPLPLKWLFENWKEIRDNIERKIGKKCAQSLEKYLVT